MNVFTSATTTALSKILLDSSGGTAGTYADKLRAALRIRRVEFIPFGISIILFPLAATNNSRQELFWIDLLLVCAAIYFAAHFGNMINCLADRDVDAAFKSEQAAAVHVLGVRSILVQLLFALLAECVLGIVLVVRTRSPVLILLGAMAAFLSAEYSLPPMHLKSRGVLEIFTIGITVIILPGMVVMIAARHGVDLLGVVAVAGFSLVFCSLILVKTAEDLPEDRKFGINTTTVRLGLLQTIFFAIILDIAGTGIIGYFGALRHQGFTSMLILIGSGLLPSLYLFRIALSLGKHKHEEEQVTALRTHSRHVPLLLAATASGLIVGALLRDGTLITPLVLSR